MSNAKDIRSQIKSIKSTQKITKAMEMVAASKMRRAQENMQLGRPYTRNILRVIARLLSSSENFDHPFLNERSEIKNVGYLVVSTDRGLCGGLNINLFKKLLEHIQEQRAAGRGMRFSVLGRKALGFLSRVNADVVFSLENYGDNPALHELIAAIKVLQDDYNNGLIDRIYVVGNQFVNTMTQSPRIEQILPARIIDAESLHTPEHQWDYVYDSSVPEILESLLTHYVEALVKQVVAENIACEMSARMIAMKSASDNAGSLIGDLQLQYNKARQAAITQELSEIVGGAAAV